MANLNVSDIPTGYELLSDTETFLDNLNNEEANVIYGGKKFGGGNLLDKCPTGIAQGTALTARPVCITNPGGLDPKPHPQPTPPVKPHPRPTPPLRTGPIYFSEEH
jgi:hypothetical protein